MRFNNQKHSERSVLVQMEQQLINALFNDDQRDKFIESQVQLGASIENQHLQAALVDRLSSSNKTEIVQKKVTEVVAAKSDHERPLIKLEDGTEIEPRLLIGSDGEKSMTR